MNKTETIARKLLGWKLNRWDRWYDTELGTFIPVAEFKPEQSIEDAMIIVKKLEKFGFTYNQKGEFEVCFNNICETGETLAQAITNAAYLIADTSSTRAEEWL
ncbi:hypothetical protein [Bacillus sp. B15-48]|uniref:BC1872 family protein n=1 Tax=Bacillus sp. B15-48 TaxID=1548601 RepID=UPI00193FE141|nr:hypothetical protein [Bacillus sp. B15-48]MBM4763439.1 hypothetical protein [Bacillus sp. B15-48]